MGGARGGRRGVARRRSTRFRADRPRNLARRQQPTPRTEDWSPATRSMCVSVCGQAYLHENLAVANLRDDPDDVDVPWALQHHTTSAAAAVQSRSFSKYTEPKTHQNCWFLSRYISADTLELSFGKVLKKYIMSEV